MSHSEVIQRLKGKLPEPEQSLKDKILECLKEHGKSTPSEIAKRTGENRDSVASKLTELKKIGRVKHNIRESLWIYQPPVSESLINIWLAKPWKAA